MSISHKDRLYYRISTNENINWFFPRILTSIMVDENENPIEDDETCRICVSPYIIGCLRAKHDTDYVSPFIGDEYCVYGFRESYLIKNGFEVVVPTSEQVNDVSVTSERWIVGIDDLPASRCCIRPIRIGRILIFGCDDIPTSYGDESWMTFTDLKWKWIERCSKA